MALTEAHAGESGDGARLEILVAAADCFAERGYAVTSIDDVARRLGATKGRIYHHFPSKGDLFAEVFRAGMDMNHAAIAPLSELPGPALPRWRRMAMAHVLQMIMTKPFQRAVWIGVEMHLAGATTPEMLVPVARRIADLGWHVQVHALDDQLARLEAVLLALHVPVVLDHIARIPVGTSRTDAALARALRLLASGRFWVKLSAPYLESRVGAPSYQDLDGIVGALAREAPERLLWGTDWPHPSESANPPDDHGLLRALQRWVGAESLTRRVLVDNPAALYRF